MITAGITRSFTEAHTRAAQGWRRRVGAALCLVTLPSMLASAAPQQDGSGRVAPDAQASTPATSPETATAPTTDTGRYTAPPTSQRLDADVTARPLLAAVRAAAASFDERDWVRTSTQEMGKSTFDRFDRLFEKERIQRVRDGFVEGYSQVFIELPEAIIVTAMEMKDEQSASDYYLMELQSLQITLDGINQSEDGRAEVTLEADIVLAGLDDGYDKRYEVYLGDLPPSRFRVLFGRAGHRAMLVTFMQTDVDDEAARGLLDFLSVKLNNLPPADESASR